MLWHERKRVLTYDEVMAKLWPSDLDRPISVLHTFVGQLRRKLGNPTLIENIRGVGYRFHDMEEDAAT